MFSLIALSCQVHIHTISSQGLHTSLHDCYIYWSVSLCQHKEWTVRLLASSALRVPSMLTSVALRCTLALLLCYNHCLSTYDVYLLIFWPVFSLDCSRLHILSKSQIVKTFVQCLLPKVTLTSSNPSQLLKQFIFFSIHTN